MGTFEEDEGMQQASSPEPNSKEEDVDPKVKRKSLLMQSLAAKYLTSETPTKEGGDGASKTTEEVDQPVKLREKKGRRDVRESALFKSLTSKYLSCEIEESPVEPEVYKRKSKELDKSEAELPMGKSKFERIQGLLNQNLADRFNPKDEQKPSDAPILEEKKTGEPQSTEPPPPPPPAPPLPPSLKRSFSVPETQTLPEEDEQTRELLGASSAKSRVEVNKQRKRRPPSRRLVKSMYEHISIEELPEEVPEKKPSQQMHKDDLKAALASKLRSPPIKRREEKEFSGAGSPQQTHKDELKAALTAKLRSPPSKRKDEETEVTTSQQTHKDELRAALASKLRSPPTRRGGQKEEKDSPDSTSPQQMHKDELKAALASKLRSPSTRPKPNVLYRQQKRTSSIL